MPVKIITIGDGHLNQRIDNFLIAHLKGVPQSRIYRALRQGEVRVNKGRVRPTYRLQMGDQVRLPPLRIPIEIAPPKLPASLAERLQQAVLFENTDWMVLNKPVGLAVHGGSDVHIGVIEALRQLKPEWRQADLVHRLDRETSGCLLIAKNRPALLKLQSLMRLQKMTKEYIFLAKGYWPSNVRMVDAPLLKREMSGEQMVVVDPAGKPAKTIFAPLRCDAFASLVRAQLITGRTHQIRVHAAFVGHPIAGDAKYGDAAFNKEIAKKRGDKRLFLHAEQLSFILDGRQYQFEAASCYD